jgi:hypothetical protein
MTIEGGERFNVTGEEVSRYDWKARIPEKRSEHWLSTEAPFAAAAKEHQEQGDDIGCRVYSLLHAVTSFHPNFDAKGNPFGPAWSAADGSRSIMAEDLSDKDLEALKAIVNDIPEPDFRARVADVLWESKRDYKAAQVAVGAYLEAADRVKTADLWPPYTERMERAAQLAAKLGFGKSLHQKVLTSIESAIAEFEHDISAGLLCHRLMLVLLSHDAGDASKYAPLSERLAGEFGRLRTWDFSQWYWELAGQWHAREKNEADAQRCQLAAAECLVSKAEDPDNISKLGLGFAAHWMGAGVQALRQAKADPNRIQELHHRFLQLQRESLTQLNPLELNVDEMPGFRETEEQVRDAAVAHVSGYSFQRAVVRLAHITKPTDTAHLRDQVKSQSDQLVWDKIVGSEALDHTGKVADKMPPIGFGSDNIEDVVLRKKMVQQAKEIGWQLSVVWRIEPARVAIFKENPIRRRDLFFLVLHNPFIPAGHEGIFLRGLQAGFFGDWLVAMHLLIPQVEASIRHVFQQHGIVTSTLESDGTQSERDLNQLLWMPQMEDIFGPDITFDLRGILIERFGENMRNESAHGLMPEGAFYRHTAVYFWWLVLYLCVTAHVQTRIPAERPAQANSASDAADEDDTAPRDSSTTTRQD